MLQLIHCSHSLITACCEINLTPQVGYFRTMSLATLRIGYFEARTSSHLVVSGNSCLQYIGTTILATGPKNLPSLRQGFK